MGEFCMILKQKTIYFLIVCYVLKVCNWFADKMIILNGTKHEMLNANDERRKMAIYAGGE